MLSESAFAAGQAVAGSLSSGLRNRLAVIGGNAAFVLRAEVRRQALRNYAALMGLPVADPRVGRVARRALVGYSKLLVDFLAVGRMAPAGIRELVDVEGLDHVHNALAGGGGAIIVTPHFGNWDVAAAAAVAHGIPVVAVTDQWGDDGVNAAVAATRRRMGIEVVPLTRDAGRAALRALRENKVLALVCDLPKEGRSVRVDLCGQAAMVPAGPAVLALRTGAPVIPITCRRTAGDSYLLRVEEPVSFNPRGDDQADVAALAQAIVDRFAKTLLKNLDQWYLFSPMWGLADGVDVAALEDRDDAATRGRGAAAVEAGAHGSAEMAVRGARRAPAVPATGGAK